MTATFMLEAGLSRRCCAAKSTAMAAAARRAGVPIVGGDTKVVEHGKADGMYISTTGLGVVDIRAPILAPSRIRAGDRVLLSGPIGNHGMAIMLARAELEIEADIRIRHAAALTHWSARLLDSRRHGRPVDARRDARRRGHRAQ